VRQHPWPTVTRAGTNSKLGSGRGRSGTHTAERPRGHVSPNYRVERVRGTPVERNSRRPSQVHNAAPPGRGRCVLSLSSFHRITTLAAEPPVQQASAEDGAATFFSFVLASVADATSFADLPSAMLLPRCVTLAARGPREWVLPRVKIILSAVSCSLADRVCAGIWPCHLALWKSPKQSYTIP
jgi:hypothetical protein